MMSMVQKNSDLSSQIAESASLLQGKVSKHFLSWVYFDKIELLKGIDG